MKERPILFSGPMVRAIIERRKTQTRRIIKNQALVEHDNGKVLHVHSDKCPGFCDYACENKCPYGKPGDRLWVREKWALTNIGGEQFPVYSVCDSRTDYGGPWRPSIHMFRHYSRINLRIKNIRVERLQDISEEDTRKEGVSPTPLLKAYPNYGRSLFQKLWESINGEISWQLNPFVWVVEFQLINKPSEG